MRKIEKVTVIEDAENPHPDSTIARCLKRFEVEIWDWEKMDISSKVISRSSKSIREIRLHSSGNEAVWREWCAPGGFRNRVKFPKVSACNYLPMRMYVDFRMSTNIMFEHSCLKSIYRFMR